jgi:hypothetical protein
MFNPSNRMSAQPESTIMSREKIIESASVDFHNASLPRLIPVLQAEPPVPPAEQVPLKEEQVPPTEEQVPPTEELPPPAEPASFEYNFSLFPDAPDYKFGIFKLKIADTPMLTQTQVLDSNSDISGSMSDFCKDGKTKMQHAKHTLKNIVTALAKSEGASVAMATYGFDDKVEEIFQDTKITPENAADLRNKLDQLEPRNGTDIYKALELQAKRATARHAVNPSIRQTTITMTDGQANQGKTSYSEMATQVAPNCTNIFIGFGGDHNAIGLQQLADAQPNGSYFYVAEIEKAGIVFGEVIHQMLYTALTNITISTENAEIYDYKTNTWSTSIQVPSIVSEAIKTYHLRATDPLRACVRVSAQSAVHGDQEPAILELDDVILHNHPDKTIDLSIYMLRQRTQELTFKAHQHSLKLVNDPKLSYAPDTRDAYYETQKSIRKELTDYLRFMKQFAKEQNLEEDELLGTLIDDIVIILQTFGGHKAVMYSSVRTGSQGRQTSNNVGYVAPEDMVGGAPRIHRHLGLRRQNAWTGVEPQEDDDMFDASLLSPPALTRALTRTHTTPRQMTLMRECSQGSAVAELDEEEPPKAIPFPAIGEDVESEAGSGV